MTKQELLKLFQKLCFEEEEITKEDLENIILNISSELEFKTLDACIRRKYQCFDMEAGAYMSELTKEYRKELEL